MRRRLVELAPAVVLGSFLATLAESAQERDVSSILFLCLGLIGFVAMAATKENVP